MPKIASHVVRLDERARKVLPNIRRTKRVSVPILSASESFCADPKRQRKTIALPCLRGRVPVGAANIPAAAPTGWESADAGCPDPEGRGVDRARQQPLGPERVGDRLLLGEALPRGGLDPIKAAVIRLTDDGGLDLPELRELDRSLLWVCLHPASDLARHVEDVIERPARIILSTEMEACGSFSILPPAAASRS